MNKTVEPSRCSWSQEEAAPSRSLLPLRLLTGMANPELARKVSQAMNIELSHCRVEVFPDSETIVKLDDDVRGRDVFVLQPTCRPVNQHLMELLITMDCLRRASASRITAVIPYFGYARQDRKDEGRVPITAKLVANLLITAGADRVLTMDLHAAQIQGFFDIPVDHLTAMPVIARYIEEVLMPRYELNRENTVVVSPDIGNTKRAAAYAQRFKLEIAIVDKCRRDGHNVEAARMIGDVKDKNVLMFDDMISTAGTVTTAAAFVKRQGARRVIVSATHPVLSGPALDRIASSPIDQLLVTDTIPISSTVRERLGDGLAVLSVDQLLAEAITRIHTNQSISLMFRKGEK